MSVQGFSVKLQQEFPEELVHSAVLPEIQPTYQGLQVELHENLLRFISSSKVKLYSHQAEVVEHSVRGENVMITTPTASGKTLAFNLSVLNELAKESEGTALYLYPLKALAQDQLQSLLELERQTGIQTSPAIYDGDTPSHRRRSIRNQSRIILTNPHALHQYLPWHQKWKRFFSNLKYVVLDESHVYRGVFGSNVAMLIRRLRRIANRYGANPQFILSSATLANPKEHSQKLVGLDFQIVSESGAPRGERHIHFWNSVLDEKRSVNRQTSDLLALSVRTGLQTLCFTTSRRLAELVAKWAGENGNSNMIASYRAGYSPDERRELEKSFREGALKGIASTTALELGIDIGSLDSVIISGYPGTITSTWQMGGRAGRGSQPASMILVGFENPLDQYFMKHPEQFFDRHHEHAIIDLDNPHVLLGHAMCAAAELPIMVDRDASYFGDDLERATVSLADQSLAQETPAGHVYRGVARPTDIVSLNAMSDQAVQIMFNDHVLETLDLRRACDEAYAGAVFLHRGEAYIIKHLDLKLGVAWADKHQADYYTVPERISDVNLNKYVVKSDKPFGSLFLAEVQVHEEIPGFKMKKGNEKLGVHALELPAFDFETVALGMTLNAEIASCIRRADLDWTGGLHAAEHAMIAMTPFHAMCDRWDIGGLSTPFHRDTSEATIFIYDGYEGGMGIAEKAYELFDKLAQTTFELVRDCDCEDGCPSCIYSPKCGNNNEPLDKAAAVIILDKLKN